MTGLSDQSHPPERGLPAPRHWPRLTFYALRAVAELVRARIIFARITVPAIQARNLALRNVGGTRFDVKNEHAGLAQWIAYIMPRAARRLPFRSDCLVQALAAQNWLAAYGIASNIVIGAERPDGKPFAAHAWLMCENAVITGGETGQYTVIL